MKDAWRDAIMSLAIAASGNLKSAARGVRQVAADLERAAEIERRRAEGRHRAKRYRAKIREIKMVLANHMHNGMSADAAIRAGARETGLEPQQLQTLIPAVNALRRRLARAERKRFIGEMYWRGHTNGEIAAAVGLSERQVKRILKTIREEIGS